MQGGTASEACLRSDVSLFYFILHWCKSCSPSDQGATQGPEDTHHRAAAMCLFTLHSLQWLLPFNKPQVPLENLRDNRKEDFRFLFLDVLSLSYSRKQMERTYK